MDGDTCLPSRFARYEDQIDVPRCIALLARIPTAPSDDALVLVSPTADITLLCKDESSARDKARSRW